MVSFPLPLEGEEVAFKPFSELLNIYNYLITRLQKSPLFVLFILKTKNSIMRLRHKPKNIKNHLFLDLYHVSDVQCRKRPSTSRFRAFAHLRQGQPLPSGKSGFDHVAVVLFGNLVVSQGDITCQNT